MCNPTLNNPNRKMALWKIILAITLCMAVPILSENGWPKGDLRKTDYKDLKDHPIDSKTYNEFWTYHFILDGGLTVVLNYSRANLGSMKDPVCGADVSLIGFKGKNYSVAREYPKKKFRFTDSKQQLNVHEKIWFEGELPREHRVYFNTRKKKVSYLIDLKFSDIEPGVTWGDGVFHLNKEKIGIFVHIPRARVTGVVAINSDTLQVEGLATMDHTFQSVMGTDLVESGYRFYSLENEVLLGNFVKPLSKYKTAWVGFGLMGQPGSLNLVKPEKLELSGVQKIKGIPVPQTLEVGGGGNQIKVSQKKMTQKLSILDGFDSWFEKKAVKIFLGGEMIHFRGAATLNGKPGLFNYFGID